MNDPMQFKSVKEVSFILQVSTPKVAKLCVEGQLSRVNINPNGKRPRWRIPLESLEQFLLLNS